MSKFLQFILSTRCSGDTTYIMHLSILFPGRLQHHKCIMARYQTTLLCYPTTCIGSTLRASSMQAFLYPARFIMKCRHSFCQRKVIYYEIAFKFIFLNAEISLLYVLYIKSMTILMYLKQLVTNHQYPAYAVVMWDHRKFATQIKTPQANPWAKVCHTKYTQFRMHKVLEMGWFGKHIRHDCFVIFLQICLLTSSSKSNIIRSGSYWAQFINIMDRCSQKTIFWNLVKKPMFEIA